MARLKIFKNPGISGSSDLAFFEIKIRKSRDLENLIPLPSLIKAPATFPTSHISIPEKYQTADNYQNDAFEFRLLQSTIEQAGDFTRNFKTDATQKSSKPLNKSAQLTNAIAEEVMNEIIEDVMTETEKSIGELN